MTKEHIEKLISQLTLEEKVGMIHGDGFFTTKGVERLGIPPFKTSDGPRGVRKDFKNGDWKEIGLSYDAVSYLPCNSAIAATWNRQLAYATGQILGKEARGRGKDMILAPGINIMRTPLCGRSFEYMGEDPFLTSEMVVPLIQGIEENDVASCVKHFALNNQETNRLAVSAEVSERALREIYLPAFEAAVKRGGVMGVMGAYNKLRGTHCCHNKHLLVDILRHEWKFDGVTISDWGGVHDTKEALENGLDIEMDVKSNFDDYYMAKPLIDLIESGEVNKKKAMAKIDEKVRHILNLMNRLHMLDGDRQAGSYNDYEDKASIRQVARESIVLLKNDDKVLPLDKKKIKKLLVIGENANKQHADGGGSAEIKALYEITPLQGINMFVGGNCDITYKEGYLNDAEVDEALEAAQSADAVIFVGGLNHEYDVEGRDRENMKLPYEQDKLIKELIKVRPDTVVVLTAGSPVDMTAWINDVPTLVFNWYNGMEGGIALAEVLFGEVNPSGKLPETFPVDDKSLPTVTLGEYPGEESVSYGEDIFVGYRYYDTYDINTAFPFGYGLSYTDFVMSGLMAEVLEDSKENKSVKVSFNVSNIGDRAGATVAQIYVADKYPKVRKAAKELKAFEKVYLEAGETKEVTLILEKEAFTYYDEKARAFKVDSGNYMIMLATNADDVVDIYEIVF
jgi:beta-glucosidase